MHRFIRAERANHSVADLCRILDVSRAGSTPPVRGQRVSAPQAEHQARQRDVGEARHRADLRARHAAQPPSQLREHPGSLWRRPALRLRTVGHKDVRFTLNVYSKAVKRRAKLSGVYLTKFEKTLAWAALPTTEWAATGSESGIRADRLSGLPSDLA